jgi:hypothetical protein
VCCPGPRLANAHGMRMPVVRLRWQNGMEAAALAMPNPGNR